jgi:hypothetical protein
MKTLIYSFFYLALLIFISNVRAQDSSKSPDINQQYYKVTVRNPPDFTLQFNLQYDYGVFELSSNDNGDFNSTEFIDGNNFGVRHGIGGTATAKIPLQKKGYIRLNISAAYNYFTSKFSKANVGYSGTQQFVNYNVFTGGVGIENNFTPSLQFKTLVGLSVLASVISGGASLIFDPASTELTNLNIKPAFRLGLAINSGFEYLINNNFGVNFGIQFTHANLWLKKSQLSESNTTININDQRVSPRIPFSGFKQFVYGSFYCGVNLYFGVIKKEYIIQKY